MGEFKMGQLHCLGTKQGGAGVVVLWQQENSKSPAPFGGNASVRSYALVVTLPGELAATGGRNLLKRSTRVE